MALFVHFAPVDQVTRIKRHGLRAGRHTRGVYAVPATPDFYASHQWLRELKRCHAGKTLAAIYVRVDGAAPALFGPYGGPHTIGTANMAVAALMARIAKRDHLNDEALGFEAILDGPITADAITSVRILRQVTGWRFYPKAKGRRPCACPACLGRGEPFSQRIRTRFSID